MSLLVSVDSMLSQFCPYPHLQLFQHISLTSVLESAILFVYVDRNVLLVVKKRKIVSPTCMHKPLAVCISDRSLTMVLQQPSVGHAPNLRPVAHVYLGCGFFVRAP